MKIQKIGTGFVFAISLVALLCMLSLEAGEKGVQFTENRDLSAQLASTLYDTDSEKDFLLVENDSLNTFNTETYLEPTNITTVTTEPVSIDETTAVVLDDETSNTNVTPELVRVASKKCPLESGTGKTILTFTDNLLLTTALRPGFYEVVLASSHLKNTGLNAVFNESWHLALLNDSRITLLRTQPIRDLRDDELFAVERVEKSIALHEKATRARVVLPKDVDFSLDFTPLCASLRFLGDLPIDNNNTTTLAETTLFDSASLIDSFNTTQEESKESFITEQQNETITSFQENSPIFTGVTVIDDSTVNIESKNTATSFSQTVDGAVTSSAFAYTADPEGVTGAFTYSKVFREGMTAGLEEDLLTKLEQASQTHRKALFEKVLSDMGVQSEALQSVELSRRSLEEGHLEQIEAGDANRAFEAFRFIKRAELGDATDSDGDGVTDYDEVYIYGTNPFNPHTGNSILTDGERIVLGLDPLKNDMETVAVETPRLKGEVREELFSINSIEFVSDTLKDETGEQKRPIRIRGIAPPLSFVTLFVYSTPIVVTVRANKNGVFEYTLKETLEDGTHEVYVASVNTSGKVLVKSQPIPFVKTAEAIEYVPAMVSAQQNPVNDAMQTVVVLALLCALLLGIGVVILIGHYKAVPEEVILEKHDHEGE